MRRGAPAGMLASRAALRETRPSRSARRIARRSRPSSSRMVDAERPADLRAGPGSGRRQPIVRKDQDSHQHIFSFLPGAKCLRGWTGHGAAADRPGRWSGPSAVGRAATSTWPARSTRRADWLHRAHMRRPAACACSGAHPEARRETAAEAMNLEGILRAGPGSGRRQPIVRKDQDSHQHIFSFLPGAKCLRGWTGHGAAADRPGRWSGPSAVGRAATSTWPARSTRRADWLHRAHMRRPAACACSGAHPEARRETAAEAR